VSISLKGLSLIAADQPQHTHTDIPTYQSARSDDEERGFGTTAIVRRSFGVERVGRFFFCRAARDCKPCKKFYDDNKRLKAHQKWCHPRPPVPSDERDADGEREA